jgi:hypothetical protein
VYKKHNFTKKKQIKFNSTSEELVDDKMLSGPGKIAPGIVVTSGKGRKLVAQENST